MTDIKPFPLSFFESVKTPVPIDTLTIGFNEFINLMHSFSDEQFSSKEAAPLIASTSFKSNHRKKANATMSGLVILDIDDGQTIDATIDMLDHMQIESLVYSTASHRDDHHKFRVCIPLAEPVNYETHVKAWHAINYVFADENSDKSKVGCESLFYVAGQYPNALNIIENTTGDIISAPDWIEIADLIEEPKTRKKLEPASKPSGQRFNGSKTARSVSCSDIDIYETKLITDASLQQYQSSSGDWHHARFRLMMSIAGRASRLGISITVDDVINLFNQIDMIDGAHYQSPEYQKQITNDAAKAFGQAGGGAS